MREGAFYGWPWYYIGANEDPRHEGERPDLKDKITVPDVLIQAHSASLGMTFYDGTQFPADYRGNIFAAEHGSWNRTKRTGYKIIRVIVKDGVPTGEYDDFATGFVINDAEVWGRPVGVAVDKDGALLVSEDASGTIWRITYSGKAARGSLSGMATAAGTLDRTRRCAGSRAWRHSAWIHPQATYFRSPIAAAPLHRQRPPDRLRMPSSPHPAASSKPISRRASMRCRSGDFISW